MGSALCKAQAGEAEIVCASAGAPCAHLVLLVLRFASLCVLPVGKAGIDQVDANILPT